MTVPDPIRKRGISRATDNLPEQFTVVLPAGVVLRSFGAEIQTVINRIRERNHAQSETSVAAGSE